MSPVTDAVIQIAFAPAPQPRRVLVYAPLALSTPHFETDLEIAQRHLDLGDEVELVVCDAELPSCQLNPAHETQRCIQCVSRNLQGAAQLSAKVPVLGLRAALTPEDHAALAGLPAQFATQEELRAFRFENFDAGLAALSSLIDFARSPRLDTARHAGLVQQTLRGAVLSFLALKRILAARRPDRAYIYNGRWGMVRSAVRACEAAGVPWWTHERGSDFRKFALYAGVLPHDKADFQRQALGAWRDAATQPDSRALAERFFSERRQRVEKTWFSYTKQQEQGRVPADWPRAARRIVFFTTSEFEYAAIADDTAGRIYPSQRAGARRIAQHLAQADAEAHLWVRVHPNDKGAETTRAWTDAVAGLANVTLILPEATIDSYALLDGADRVLTFGSTMGIEATFWGRAAICADHSFYGGNDAIYDAASEAELLDLLTRRGLPPKPREQVLPFGYYLNAFGEEFRHFSTEKISDYEFRSPFRGRCLKPDFDDLRQRLISLHREGDVHRAAALARLCAAFRPADPLGHTLLILGSLAQGQLPAAVAALETAVRATPALLDPLLKQTARPLLDAAQQFARGATAADFPALALRLGAVLAQSPTLAPIGQKLIAMAQRPRAAA